MASLQAWRLSKMRYAGSAFTGEGAATLGGRWNPVGVPVVYASLSLSLAVLEVFVHMTGAVAPADYVYVAADLKVDESKAERVKVAELPANWRTMENRVLQEIGAAWARSRRSLALLIPSVVVEGEWNVLINPLHPDAMKIVLAEPKPFHFDQRMFLPRV